MTPRLMFGSPPALLYPPTAMVERFKVKVKSPYLTSRCRGRPTLHKSPYAYPAHRKHTLTASLPCRARIREFKPVWGDDEVCYGTSN